MYIIVTACWMKDHTYYGLPEILRHGRIPEGGKIDTVEVLLVPEVDLVELLHVEGLVCEGSHVQVPPGGKHLTYK